MKEFNNKAFTLVELIVVIAILAILVLLGTPKLTSYVQQARLTRIQHDVRVMENLMNEEITINSKSNFDEFADNGKDLGLLIEANRLFEKEGHASHLEYVPAKGEINGLNKNNNLASLDSLNDELGIGGSLLIVEEEEFKEIYERYKIIPDEYKKLAGTKLKGTFYSNENGKVYYEPDKPISIKNQKTSLACSAIPEPDYTFEHEIGKIVKYHGSEQHLTIPSHFLVNGQCWPVRIIGEAAFMQGSFKSILIPGTVVKIENNAFKDIGLESIYIPGSVREIGSGAFDGNYEVIYGGSSSQVNGGSGGGSYVLPGGGSSNVIHRTPSAGEAGVVFNPGTNTIVRGSKSSGSDGGYYIPPYINVNGEDIPVKNIAKGAYQGLGLITIILPETLEVIEDYAFAGNQLIGITIPNSVYYIGYYAFAFNEVWKVGDIPGPDRIATIKTIIIKEEEQFEKVDNIGNIMENDVKVDIMRPFTEDLGPNLTLRNHIWVTSIGNIVIDVKYGPVSSGEESIPDNYEMAELEDFKFVADNSAPNEYHGTRGYYQYVGEKEYVVIPHIIQDTELTDYYKMFAGSDVKGVASDNKNVTNMSYMFNGSTSKSIELKYLDTSSVTNMYGMFNGSQATTLDLSSFDTSKVTNMRYMFRSSQVTTLDLSSFDTSSVTDMYGMFQSSKATTGYARTSTDAGRFNSTSEKPRALIFVVK